MAGYIHDHPELRVVSSHNAWLPPPEVPGLDVIPVVFVRHPLDRVRSVYDFERSQSSGTQGVEVARSSDIRGYVEWRLSYLEGSDRTIRDFQAMRLAPAGRGDDEVTRAIDATNRLPFVGLVEAYAPSLRSLEAILATRFDAPRLKSVHANVTRGRPDSLEARLDRLRQALGERQYRTLEAANAGDLDLWRHVRTRYAV